MVPHQLSSLQLHTSSTSTSTSLCWSYSAEGESESGGELTLLTEMHSLNSCYLD